MYSTLPLLALAGIAQAHMSMYYPPPLGAAPSINKQSTSLDKEFNFPLGCCGSDGGPDIKSPGICRGHLDRYDVETAQVTWQPGQDAYFQLTDYTYDPEAPGGTHSGGSCQVGFSVDKGVTWKVAASYHGACPYETTDGSPETQTFDFKVPTGMPEGDALFAWVWLNREHESFVNCAKVHIGGEGSGNTTTPAQPYQSSGSSTTPQQPAQSGYTPKQPQQSATSPKQPKQSSSYTEGPDNSSPSQTGDHHNHHHATATAGATTQSTQSASDVQNSDDSDADAGSDTDSDDSNSQDSDNSDTEGSGQDSDTDSDNESDDDSSSNNSTSTSYKAHPPVKQGTRRYVVDNSNCDCARDELTLSTRCFCDTASSSKRAETERKALRMYRRTLVKRVDACDWATAPSMQTSYYTVDAKCAPNAKINTPTSDDFELEWDVSCGVVQGKTDYKLEMMNCNMYAAH